MAEFSRVDVEVLDVDYEPHTPKRFGLKSATATTMYFRDRFRTHWVEGSVAEKASTIFQLDDRLESLEFEPMTIHYRANGKTHRYTPDALVARRGIKRILYEFKTRQYLSAKQAEANRNCSAGEQAGLQYGWEMRLITERDLEPYSALANHLLGFRYLEVVQRYRTILLDHVHSEGFITQGVIKSAYPQQVDDLMPAVWSLVAKNELQLQECRVPGDDSRIVLPSGFWAESAL